MRPGKRRADRIENEAVGGRVSGVGHGDEARSALECEDEPAYAPGVVSLNLPYDISRSKRR